MHIYTQEDLCNFFNKIKQLTGEISRESIFNSLLLL